MKKTEIFLLLFISLTGVLFGWWTGYPLYNYEAEVNDARCEALGRTSILTSSHSNLTFNNPAMLSLLTKKNAQAGLRLLSGFSRITIKDEDNDENSYNYQNPIHPKLTSLSVNIPYSKNEKDNTSIGLGIGYRTYYDRGANLKYKSDNSGKNKILRHGGLNTIVLAIGYRSEYKYCSGISYSIPVFSEYSSRHYRNGDVISEYEGSMKGSFFTLSGTYKLNEKILFGARIRLSYDLETEEIDFDGETDNFVTKIPSEIGLALEYKPNTKYKVYLEYLTRNFPEYSFLDLNNGFAIRSGIEFKSNILYRGGLFIQSVPIFEIISFNDFGPDPLKEFGVTAGAGLRLTPLLILDIFGAFSFFSNEINFEGPDSNYEEKNFYSQVKLGCTVGYSF